MSSDAILDVLSSPVGLGACGIAVLALALLVAPGPPRPVGWHWPLGCLVLAPALAVLAGALAWIGDAWQAGGAVLVSGLTLAVAGLWLGQAPFAHEVRARRRSRTQPVEPDDDLGGGRGPRALPPGPPSFAIDWEAFDRARATWAQSPAASPAPGEITAADSSG